MINKKIFLAFTIILLIFSLTILSAADTNSTDNKKPIIHKEVNNHSNKIQKVNKEEEKKVKSETKYVNNYSSFVKAFSDAKKSDNTYTINLKNGDYNFSDANNLSWAGATGKNRRLIINANGITFDGRKNNSFINIAKGYILELNDINLTNFQSLTSVIKNNGTLIIKNSTLSNSGSEFGSGGLINNNGILFILNSNCTGNYESYFYSKGVIYNNGTLNINNTIFRGNVADIGAIYNEGDMLINNSSFFNNFDYPHGVTLFTSNKATIINSNFINSVNVIDGYMLWSRGETLIENTTFKGKNSESSYQIDHSKSRLTIRNSKFINLGKNGVLSCMDCEAIITNSLFENNMNVASGGAIRTAVSNIYINNVTFKNNTAGQTGGAIHSFYDNLTISNSLFTDNKVNDLLSKGGAIHAFISSTNLNNITFKNNKALNGEGGAISVERREEFVKHMINNTKFINNTAINGGAIRIDYINLTLENSNFTSNHASENGGVIYYRDSPKIEISNANFKDNTANKDGGVICGLYANITITKSNFINNTAENGGANYFQRSEVNITNTNYTNNKAINGGAIHNNESGDLILEQVRLYSNEAKENGGAINNFLSYMEVNNVKFSKNTAKIGGASYTIGTYTQINNSLFNSNKATTAAALYSDSQININNSQFKANKANFAGTIYENRTDKFYPSEYKNILFIDNTPLNYNYEKKGENNTIILRNPDGFLPEESNITLTLDKKELGNYTIKNNTLTNFNLPEGKHELKLIENSQNNTNLTFIFTLDTREVPNIILNPVRGIIGENIILTAFLTDNKGKNISGGNLAFKLNGKTLRSDGRFDSTAPAMKFSIKNGVVNYTIKADLYLRNAKNLTASYSGTNTYQETNSTSVTAQIQKRYVQVTINTTPTHARQYETLTFNIKAKDITKNAKNNTIITDNTKIMIKINGVTLKNNTGKTLYLTLDKNAQTTYKYIIPAGTGGITASKAQRNYKVDAIFVGDNYYPGSRNTTNFQVERSSTTVTIQEAKTTKNNILSIKATLKDYKGNNLIGTNKVTIKINGKSYTKNGKAVYYSVKNGYVNITGIQIDNKTSIKRVMLVTGERQAYYEGRNETTNILKI